MAMEEEKESQNTNASERVTVYLSPEKKKEMQEYKKAKGYKSMSEMLRRSFDILKHVFGTEAVELQGQSIQDQLNRIEQKLAEIVEEQQIIQRQEELIDKEFEEIPPGEVPSFEQVVQDILDLIDDFEGIKDFVLMEQLRKKYSEGVVWTTLVNLKNQKVITLKKGEWKRIGK